MARSFSSGDVQALLTKYSVFCRKLRTLSEAAGEEAKKQRVVEAANRLFDQNALAHLAAEEICSGVVKSVPSADFDPLILSLHEYILASGFARHMEPWSRRLAEVEQEMSQLKPAARSARWLFASRSTRAAAEIAYYSLKSMEKEGCFEQVQALEEEAYRPVDRLAARKGFEAERERYLSILRSLVSMQRGVPDSRLTKLYMREELTLQRADVIHRAGAETEEQVKTAANAMAAAEALKLLKAAPVEELGRDRSGIRFKTLREHGFESVADVYAASEYNLSSLQGITQETARILKACAAQYVEQTKPNVRVRLSADNRTPEATRLVLSLFRHRQFTETVAALDQLMKQHQAQIDEAIWTLKAVDDGLGWLFLEADEKQRCIEAYHRLSELLEGELHTPGGRVLLACDRYPAQCPCGSSLAGL